MARFFIPEAFSVPYAAIDFEHRALVRQVNSLDACAEGRVDLLTMIDPFLTSLHAHFAGDERAMREAAFPQCNDHRRLHRECTAHVESILAKARAAGSIDHDAVSEIFTALIEVIARGDLYFREYLVGIGRLPD